VRWLQTLGPGLITAALVFGPSKLTITSKLGAEYGFSLLWIVPIAVLFMIVFTTMAGRIGLATEQSLLSSIRERFGKAAATVVGIGVFLVCISFQAGNAVGVGIALGEMTHTDANPWIILFHHGRHWTAVFQEFLQSPGKGDDYADRDHAAFFRHDALAGQAGTKWYRRRAETHLTPRFHGTRHRLYGFQRVDRGRFLPVTPGTGAPENRESVRPEG